MSAELLGRGGFSTRAGLWAIAATFAEAQPFSVGAFGGRSAPIEAIAFWVSSTTESLGNPPRSSRLPRSTVGVREYAMDGASTTIDERVRARRFKGARRGGLRLFWGLARSASTPPGVHDTSGESRFRLAFALPLDFSDGLGRAARPHWASSTQRERSNCTEFVGRGLPSKRARQGVAIRSDPKLHSSDGRDG